MPLDFNISITEIGWLHNALFPFDPLENDWHVWEFEFIIFQRKTSFFNINENQQKLLLARDTAHAQTNVQKKEFNEKQNMMYIFLVFGYGYGFWCRWIKPCNFCCCFYALYVNYKYPLSIPLNSSTKLKWCVFAQNRRNTKHVYFTLSILHALK